jgi:hypothetical protein
MPLDLIDGEARAAAEVLAALRVRAQRIGVSVNAVTHTILATACRARDAENAARTPPSASALTGSGYRLKWSGRATANVAAERA